MRVSESPDNPEPATAPDLLPKTICKRGKLVVKKTVCFTEYRPSAVFLAPVVLFAFYVPAGASRAIVAADTNGLALEAARNGGRAERCRGFGGWHSRPENSGASRERVAATSPN
jgi:hypothetical protein